MDPQRLLLPSSHRASRPTKLSTHGHTVSHSVLVKLSQLTAFIRRCQPDEGLFSGLVFVHNPIVHYPIDVRLAMDLLEPRRAERPALSPALREDTLYWLVLAPE